MATARTHVHTFGDMSEFEAWFNPKEHAIEGSVGQDDVTMIALAMKGKAPPKEKPERPSERAMRLAAEKMAEEKAIDEKAKEVAKPKAAKKPTAVTASLLSPPPKGKPGR